MEIRENIVLKPYTTFKAGGPAKYFAEPSSVEEIKEALSFACKNSLEVFVLGAGSNILVSDKGFDGLVIRLGKNFSNLEVVAEDENTKSIKAQAGCHLAIFGGKCTEESLAGAEFACGIPGTVGGAVFMNAGAYQREIKDIAVEVTYLDMDDLSVKTLTNSECDFSYRHSIFCKKNWLVLDLTVKLDKGNKEEIVAKVNELKAKRIASQPVDVPSAGSTFKRPVGYFAGTLIQESGLKGFSLDDSGAEVSPKHAGFVVNNGGKANASDILKLINYVSDKVYELNGVRLETEVRMIGDWD